MKQCCFCHKMKSFSCFSFRDDRIEERCAFCEDCMVEQVRSPDYPKKEDRGGGLLKSWIWYWDIRL